MKYAISLILILLLTSLSLFARNYTVSTNKLNVRQQASVQGKSLGVLEKGDTIFALSKDAEWTKIKYKDKYAYVSSKYIEKTQVNSKASNENRQSHILWIITFVLCTLFFPIAKLAGEKPESKTLLWTHAILSLIVYSSVIYIFLNYSPIVKSLLLSVKPDIKYINIICFQIILLVSFYHLKIMSKIMDHYSMRTVKLTFSIITTISITILSFIFINILIDSHKTLVGLFLILTPIVLTIMLITEVVKRKMTQPHGLLLSVAFIVSIIALIYAGLMSLSIAGIEFTLPTFLLLVLYHYKLLKIPIKLFKKIVEFIKQTVSKSYKAASEKEKEDEKMNAWMDDYIQTELDRLNAELNTEESADNSNKDLNKKKSLEKKEANKIANLKKEEKALYSAYQKLSQFINQVTSELSLNPIQFLLTPDKLLPRYKPATGKLINSELPEIWEMFVQKYPTELRGINHDASDEELLNVAETTQHENLQLAILSYLETIIELEACEIAIQEIALKKIAKEKAIQESKQKQTTTQQKPKQKPVAKPIVQKGVKARQEIVEEGKTRSESRYSVTFRNGEWLDKDGNKWKQYASGRFRPLRKLMIDN